MTLDNPYQAPADPTATSESTSRRIRLLLIWCMAFAVFMALGRWGTLKAITFLRGQGIPDSGIAVWLGHVLHSSVLATATTALWSLFEKRSGDKSRAVGTLRHPGHWLLLVVISMVTVNHFATIGLAWTSSPIIWIKTTICWLPIFVLAWAAFRNRGLWRVLFLSAIVLFIMAAAPLPAEWFQQLAFAKVLLPIGLVVAAISIDKPEDRRDWPHWIGIAAFCYQQLLLLLATMSVLG